MGFPTEKRYNWVSYILVNRDTRRFKVGLSGRIRERLDDLRNATDCQVDLVGFFAFDCEQDAAAREREMLEALRWQVHKGEWHSDCEHHIRDLIQRWPGFNYVDDCIEPRMTGFPYGAMLGPDRSKVQFGKKGTGLTDIVHGAG